VNAPIESLQGRLAKAQTREHQLRTKLAAAEADHAAALEQRRAYLIEGELADQKALANIDRRVVEAQSVMTGLADALKLAAERTAEAQRQFDDAQGLAQRKAEAAKVRSLISDIDRATKSLSEAEAACEKALKAAGAICPEANAALRLLQTSHHDLRIFIQQALSDLKGYASSAERGGKLRRAISNEPPPKIRTPKPETRRLFFIEHAKWNADGRVVTARQFSTHDLPPSLAEKAIGCALAVDPAHETATKLRPIFGDGYAVPADPAACIDLDALDPSIDLRRISARTVLAQQAKAAAA